MTGRLAATLALLALASGCRQILGIDDKGCPPEAVRSDPQNCGACGHDCLGGACADGVCQPVALADGAQPVTGLAVGREHVFWGDDAKTIWRVRKDGSDMPFLVGGQGLALPPASVAVDETHVYWVTHAKEPSGEVARAPIGAGPIETLTTGWPQLGAVRVGPGEVFFVGALDTTLLLAKVKKGGGAPETLYMAPSKGVDFSVGALASDAGFVYLAVDTAILRIPSTGGDAAVVHEDTFGGPIALAVDETHVYWGVSDALRRKRKDGSGDAETLAAAAVAAIALDATHVYWLAAGGVPGTGALQRIAKEGADREPELLHAGLRGAGEIALDDEAVYFTVAGEGAVRKLAK